MKFANLLVNGRFMGLRPTGVQRFATEILRAVDEILEQEGGSVMVAVPPAIDAREVYRRMQLIRPGRGNGHYWEQLHLARTLPATTLLNLCNSAPMWRADQIVTIHDAGVYDNPRSYSWRYRHWYRFMYARLRRLDARIVTVSQFSRKRLATCLDLPEATIAVVPQGGDHLLRVPADSSVLDRHGIDAQRYVLTVGSRARHKNFASLGLLGRELALAGMDLVVVGGVDAGVFAEVSQAGLPPGAKYVGHVTDAELRALYENAVMFVFASRYEGFGLPPLEALMVGCPVAVSPCGALPDVCGRDAVYIRPDSPEDIAEKVMRFVGGPARQVEAPVSDRIKRFTWKSAARALLAVVRERQTEDVL